MFYHIEKDKKKNCASIVNGITECVPLTISFHLYFLHISKVWSTLYHGSMEQVQRKECCFMFRYTFVAFCCCFSSKKMCFYHFISFSEEISNFRNKILTNQKPGPVIRNCQWKIMHNIEI